MNCFYWQEGFAAPEEGGNNEEYEYNDEQEEYQTEETCRISCHQQTCHQPYFLKIKTVSCDNMLGDKGNFYCYLN